MKNKKVILVGSSSSLLNKKIGKDIDKFDEVWRTNHSGHPKSIENYPDIIGSKYGYWYVHTNTWGNFEIKNNVLINSNKNISNYEKIILNSTDVEVLQIDFSGNIMKKMPSSQDYFGIYKSISKEKERKIKITQLHNEINSSQLIKSDYDNIYLPYCSWMKDCYDMLKKYNVNIKWPLKPTSGIRMLVYLLNNNDNISITGFDGGKGGHWYSTEDIFPTLKLGTRDMHVITQTINRKGKGFYKNKQVKHFLNEEFKFIKKLELEGRITII